MIGGVLCGLLLTSCASYAKEDRQLRSLAERVGALRGNVVAQRFQGGGLNGSRTLVVTVIRQGNREDVVREQIQNLLDTGYTALAEYPCLESGHCNFGEPHSLPAVGIDSFAAGQKITYSEVSVSAGHSALRMSFAYRAPQS